MPDKESQNLSHNALSKDSRPLRLKDSVNIAHCLGRFEADYYKVCELQRSGTASLLPSVYLMSQHMSKSPKPSLSMFGAGEGLEPEKVRSRRRSGAGEGLEPEKVWSLRRSGNEARLIICMCTLVSFPDHTVVPAGTICPVNCLLVLFMCTRMLRFC